MKQLDEERENVKQGKEIINELQTEVKLYKSVTPDKQTKQSSASKSLRVMVLNQEDEVVPSPVMSDNEDERKPTPRGIITSATSVSEEESKVKSVRMSEELLPNQSKEMAEKRKQIPKAKYPPIATRAGFMSLRHKRSKSFSFPEFYDDMSTKIDTLGMFNSIQLT